MIPSWDDSYPDQEVLKTEVDSLVQAFVGVLLEEIPRAEVEGIYFKGSAQKEWESPLDYVPELSDVDIHLLFADDLAVERHLGSARQALHIQSQVEGKYFSKVANPLHIPRPQLIVLNLLWRQEDYVPSPRKAVSVLYGKDYPEADYGDQERIRRIDGDKLLGEGEFLARFPLQVVDKPARYLWESLRSMVWHVSPLGPRVLHLLGLPTAEAWSLTRTRVVSLLKAMDESQLAHDYAEFYLSGWRYFLSKYRDSDAARSALASGVSALNRGVEIAKTWLSSAQASVK